MRLFASSALRAIPKFAALIAMSLVFVDARAGTASGPYIVWVNLEEATTSQPSVALHNYLQTQPGDEFCGGTAMGWIVFTKTRPAGMTNQLVSRALVDKNPSARRKLLSLIKSFKDSDVDDGVDGVVAFTKRNGSHMIAIDARGHIKESEPIVTDRDSKTLVDAFCKVYPENFRQ